MNRTSMVFFNILILMICSLANEVQQKRLIFSRTYFSYRFRMNEYLKHSLRLLSFRS